MPTPMSPTKPTLPGNATTDDQQDTANMSPADKLKAGLQGGAKAVGMTAMQRLAAIAQGKNPDEQALGPAQGEKAFVVKTQKDPNGSIHVYAKNENEAKQKYQQLGNPLGNALAAQEVKEEGASPMFKDSIKQDKIRSLKNLIAIAKQQGRRLRVQELELELKKLQGVDEARKANTKSSRAELNKRPRKELTGSDADNKKKEEDEAWALLQQHMANKNKQGVAEGSDELYQKAIRKYTQRVANDYLGGGNAHLYGAGNFDSEMFGVDPKQAEQDFDTLFPQYLKKLQGGGQGVAEDFSSRLRKAYDSGASSLGWKYEKDSPTWSADAEEKKPFSNYRKGWIQHNDRFGLGAEERKQTSSSNFTEPKPTSKKNSRGQQAYHIATLKDRAGNTVIMAKSPEEAKAEWERKYGMTGDRIIKVMTAQEANIGESMTTTTLKTTFEGLEDTIAGLLEEYGLENGRDFYIDGTIRTVSEQVAQDILSVLSDFELPGQTNMRKLDEQYNISLIGQGEEPVESLRIGSDSVDIKHIGEGFVRVYVNNELAETFDNGSAAFKYVKALQENLAEAEQEIISAMTAEAGEDLMKISNITEGWDDMMKAVKDRSGPQPNGGSGIKKGKRYGGADQNDDEKEEGPKDADGNPVKRGRGRPKKVREDLESIRKMRKQVAEALARIERLPEDQRNSVRVQSVVQALEESVRTAIKKAM